MTKATAFNRRKFSHITTAVRSNNDCTISAMLDLWSVTGCHADTMDASSRWMPIEHSACVNTLHPTYDHLVKFSYRSNVRETCSLLGSSPNNNTSSAYSKWDRFPSVQIWVWLFSQENRVISVIISVAMLKRKSEREQPWRPPCLAANSGETSP